MPRTRRICRGDRLPRSAADDRRAMVGSIMIDRPYDVNVCDVALPQVPERKNDLVAGHSELPAP